MQLFISAIMFSNLMRQFQDMQKKMVQNQESLRSIELSGQSASGAVNVIISGEGKVLRVRLGDAMMDDKELLEDALVAAFQDAWSQLQEKREASMKDIKIPAGLEKFL
jgi:DNA-binding YbaB/EbfC family protein